MVFDAPSTGNASGMYRDASFDGVVCLLKHVVVRRVVPTGRDNRNGAGHNLPLFTDYVHLSIRDNRGN